MKPRVFIGSSTEGINIAEAIQQNLDHEADCTIWTQGVFNPSVYTLDALIQVVRQSDFSIFVFSPDDIVQMRQNKFLAARDNVILESGIFMGRYGKDRNFIVVPRDVEDFHLPTDLLGLTLVKYDRNRVSSNSMAAVGAACSSIKAVMLSHPVMQTGLTFSLGVSRDNSPYPLKLTLGIRNTTQKSVLLTSKFFRANKSLRAANNARGNPALGEYEVKFAAPESNQLKQFTVLIDPAGFVSTWIPLDPCLSDQEVCDAIASRDSGEWHYTCDWLGPDGWHREYVESI